jgi:hypothetical protein
VTPSNPTAFPPQPDGQEPAKGISPRRLVLGLVLGGSVLLFFLILLASIVAILREASPSHQAGLSHLLVRLCLAVRHVVARRVIHFFRRG